MKEISSRTAMRLGISKDALSPYGDINWKSSAGSPMMYPTTDPSESLPQDDIYQTKIDSDLDAAVDRYFRKFCKETDSKHLGFHNTFAVGRFTQTSLDIFYFKARHLPSFWVREVLGKLQSNRISAEISRLFSLAENIEFEVGMENEFSISLERTIEVCGIPALLEIKKTILNEETSLTVAAETMRYIGNIESNTYRVERRELLETCLLNSRFVWVKDGAAVGLSYIDDPASIGVLKIAIEKEEYEDLKQDMILVLEQLEDTLLES